MKDELLTAAAAELDRAGFMPLPGESAERFFERFRQSEEAFAQFETALAEEGGVSVFDEFQVRAADRIPPEIVSEAAERTRALYGFENRRVPGFFLSGKVGALWGGCMIGDPDNGFAVMLLRSAFRKCSKWYVYERSELLAHELCHAMRQSLCDIHLEEFFAYQTGKSFLRRHFGNCFIRERDAVLFILPTFILLGATLFRELGHTYFPLWPFWVLTGIYPLFLLLRNFFSVRRVRKAEQKLLLFGVGQVKAVLFRCTFSELKTIGKMKTKEAFQEFLEEKARSELRWGIIKLRFFNREEEYL
ncbi:MAG: hypothetical protein IJV93_01780 [Lentisphaeria bacterium]|nr:hypothetical protein [Lentisphaeria bacterium]